MLYIKIGYIIWTYNDGYVKCRNISLWRYLRSFSTGRATKIARNTKIVFNLNGFNSPRTIGKEQAHEPKHFPPTPVTSRSVFKFAKRPFKVGFVKWNLSGSGVDRLTALQSVISPVLSGHSARSKLHSDNTFSCPIRASHRNTN